MQSKENVEEPSTRRGSDDTSDVGAGPTTKLRYLCLTADDYGMHPGIDRGILATLAQRLVRNVSIWTDVPVDALGAQARELLQSADIGLHLDLVPDSLDLTRVSDWPWALSRLMPTRANRASQRERLLRGMTTLQQAGLEVKFVNGHQHIHLLPGWCEWLVEVLKPLGLTWLRCPRELGAGARVNRRKQPKLLILEFLARRAARKHGNLWWFPAICRWGCGFVWSEVLHDLTTITTTGIEVVVHPGYPDQDYLLRTGSLVGGARQAELLQHPQLAQQLLDRGWQPARLSEWAAVAGNRGAACFNTYA